MSPLILAEVGMLKKTYLRWKSKLCMSISSWENKDTWANLSENNGKSAAPECTSSRRSAPELSWNSMPLQHWHPSLVPRRAPLTTERRDAPNNRYKQGRRRDFPVHWAARNRRRSDGETSVVVKWFSYCFVKSIFILLLIFLIILTSNVNNSQEKDRKWCCGWPG